MSVTCRNTFTSYYKCAVCSHLNTLSCYNCYSDKLRQLSKHWHVIVQFSQSVFNTVANLLASQGCLVGDLHFVIEESPSSLMPKIAEVDIELVTGYLNCRLASVRTVVGRQSGLRNGSPQQWCGCGCGWWMYKSAYNSHIIRRRCSALDGDCMHPAHPCLEWSQEVGYTRVRS